MFIRGSRSHAIALIRSVKTTFPTVWACAIATSTILLILIHVRSIVRARVVRMAIWVLTSPGLLWMALLRLSAGASLLLLALGGWVWCSVTAILALSGCGVTGLSLLRRTLRELRGSLSLRAIVSTERSLGLLSSRTILLALSTLL
jgi:hypothetical protein